MNTSFDFEKPIADLQQQIEKVQQVSDKTKVDMKTTVAELEAQLNAAKEQIYTNLTGWQKVQISRHPERPYTLQYIEMMCDSFIELHGEDKYRQVNTSEKSVIKLITSLKVIF